LHTVEYCAGTALGMESGRISDADISASSSYARSVGPEHARYKIASASLYFIDLLLPLLLLLLSLELGEFVIPAGVTVELNARILKS